MSVKSSEHVRKVVSIPTGLSIAHAQTAFD